MSSQRWNLSPIEESESMFGNIWNRVRERLQADSSLVDLLADGEDADFIQCSQYSQLFYSLFYLVKSLQ